jgi:hypothetical protein
MVKLMLPTTVLGIGLTGVVDDAGAQPVAWNQILIVKGPCCSDACIFDAGEYPTSPVAALQVIWPVPTTSTLGATAGLGTD